MPTPVASTSSFAITQGLINMATQSYAFNVSSADSYGNLYTLTYSSSPGQISTFGTTPASTANISQILYVNSGLIQSVSSTNYFIPSPYQFLGSQTVRPGGSEVANTWAVPPIMGIVGQSFPSFTGTLYHDSTNTVIDATLTETIGLSPDTATTALLCLTDTVQLTQAGINDNLSVAPSSNCFRIDPNGNVLGMQITTQVNGLTMLFY